MPEPAPPEALFHYLLTNSEVVGLLTWVGFAGTALGLAIALWQISKVKNAADAAASAAVNLAAAVHSRERLLELSSARGHLDSGRQHLAQPDFSKANIFLEIARTECLQVSEMLMLDRSELEQQAVYKIIVQLTKLIEKTSKDDARKNEDQSKLQRVQEAREIGDAMDSLHVRLRYRFEYKEIKS